MSSFFLTVSSMIIYFKISNILFLLVWVFSGYYFLGFIKELMFIIIDILNMDIICNNLQLLNARVKKFDCLFLTRYYEVEFQKKEKILMKAITPFNLKSNVSVNVCYLKRAKIVVRISEC